MSEPCPLVNQDTGARCRLDAGHPPPHEPKEPPAVTPAAADGLGPSGAYAKARARATASSARLRTVDQAVEAGRRGRKVEVPAGTFPIRPPTVYRCIYDCDAPARLYPAGPRCEHHSPAAARARAQESP